MGQNNESDKSVQEASNTNFKEDKNIPSKTVTPISTEEFESEDNTQKTTMVINDDGFEEIQSADKVSVADSEMPQTGEDDGFRILGIVVFSVVAAVSFYKYKTTK